jgi:pimeloyl-ACP methyl ester carboxylesterase
MLAYLGLLFLLQRRIIYMPPRPPGSRPVGVEIVQLRMAEGPVEALFLPPSKPVAGPAPLILFTHGNAELADHSIATFEQARSEGWAVLLVEYPGYGNSSGSPSEKSIVAVAHAAFDWVLADSRIDPKRMVAWGHSLGSGPACRLAAERPIVALVLEAPFTSLRSFAAGYLAPGFLVRDPFDNMQALRSYRGPVLVLHGTEDVVVPIRHGRAIAAAFPNAELHELPCGHTDCSDPWFLVRPFLRRAGV